MLEPTKKHHTEESVEVCFKIRKDAVMKVKQAVQPYLADEEDENESRPWRDVFRDVLGTVEEDYPGVSLRGARHKEGLTQKELAKLVGIRPEHISAMENNRRPIGKAMAKRFGEVLNIDYRLFL